MPKIQKIYVWDKQVRPSTLLVVHFPFENDELDYSLNKVSMTSYGTKSFTTLSSWKKVLNASAWQLLSDNNFISKYLSDHVYTVCYWVNPTKDYTYRRNHFTIGGYSWQGSMEIWATTYNTQGTRAWLEKIYFDGTPWSQSLSWWRNVIITINKGSWIAYINWVQYTTWSRASVADGILWIGNGCSRSSNDRLTGYISEFSIELGNWTQQKITEYFNNTKSLYWIS